MSRFSPARAVVFCLGVLGASGFFAAGCGDLIIPAEPDASTSGDAARSDTGEDPLDGGSDALVVDCNAQSDAGRPTYLQCTGLYSDFAKKTISPDAKPFDPGLHLWSDGAEKFRWIYLPPGTQIDATDPNEWIFPVGTKIWKEFRLLGKKVETRLLWKISAIHWFRTTYEWNDEETQAVELTAGRTNVRGLGYDIPATDLCTNCHQGRKDFVLGLEYVSGSSPLATGVTVDSLRAANMIKNLPPGKPQIPGDPNAAGALGFFHANCGTGCHSRSPSAFAATTGLFLRLEVNANGALPATVPETDTYKTSVGIPSTFTPAGEPAGSFQRIKPRDIAHSSIPWRDGRRDPTQMPPLATHLVDVESMKIVHAWINTL
jgi:hypothetical protein